jgi:Tfp pilus assembly protein PilN
MMRRIDLLPESYLQRQRERRAVAAVVVGGSVLVFLLFVWFVMLTLQISHARQELAVAQEQNQRLESDIASLQKFGQLESRIQSEKASLATVMAGDIDWPALLTQVASATPGDISLTTLTASAGQTEGATQVGTETNPIRISSKQPVGRAAFTGNALSMRAVNKWLTSLATVPNFHAIWLNNATAAQTASGSAAVAFDSTVELGARSLSGRFQPRQP